MCRNQAKLLRDTIFSLNFSFLFLHARADKIGRFLYSSDESLLVAYTNNSGCLGGIEIDTTGGKFFLLNSWNPGLKKF
ncbi:hypothetical protein HZS_7249 [Henneguya salminicola]|nr:hypothetical protein HZS_7249 [Henneguya salminicola]